eukprot:1142184-Pelagomonas_calceolata.AAC.6
MNLTQLQLQNSIGDVDYGTLRLDGNDITVSGVVFDALSDGECCLSPTKMLAEIFFQPRHHSAVLIPNHQKPPNWVRWVVRSGGMEFENVGSAPWQICPDNLETKVVQMCWLIERRMWGKRGFQQPRLAEVLFTRKQARIHTRIHVPNKPRPSTPPDLG